MWPWSSTEKKLRKAAEKGDVAKVRELLEAGNADVDARNKSGWTPLHHASGKGRAAVVELLLKSDATVDAAAVLGWTPLHIASANGHAAVVELLRKANASVDAAKEDGSTPLHYASSQGHAAVVELLLKSDATVDAADVNGSTPLHNASLYGHPPVVELLLKANASVDVSNNGLETPLHGACEYYRPDVVRLLLKSGANLCAKDKDGFTPLHRLLKARDSRFRIVDSKTLHTLQVLVTYGAVWDTKCEEIVLARKAWDEAPALALCMRVWTQELAAGLPFSNIPIEAVKRGTESTQQYIDSLKSSLDVVLRRKICLVGPSCAGKTSFVKSITTQQPQLVHLDDRTIGIDHFPLRFEQPSTKRKDVTIHEVTFWDFAGQDAYQVAHSLFFSPRTLFLVCVDLEAFTVAFVQASIMANMKKQETQLMNEFIERTVMQWIRMIIARQPDAEFVFVATKEDLLQENKVTERLLKTALVAKLTDVETITHEMRQKQEANVSSSTGATGSVNGPGAVFVSCTSSASVQSARAIVEDLISKSDRSFQMPDAYTEALQAIVAMRVDAKSHDITTRIERVFAAVDTLPAKLNVESKLCRTIVQTLHDLGDVLWYEDLGVELFQDKVILDPLLMIDFIRQVINHNYTGQTMPHSDLKALPYWSGFSDKEQMKAMKQVLQKFRLVYSANEDHTMSWNSDLIVPAYWQTKTPASWLWLGDSLRINETKSCEGEAVRVDWEFHFEFGLPASLFDHLVVANVSPYFTFDAGPDWILYEKKEIAACRIMVGRDVKTLHRTIHVEAVVAEAAETQQVAMLWSCFSHFVTAFFDVMGEYPGLTVSSFAWDDAQHKIGLERLVGSSANLSPMSAKWMPPVETWMSIRPIMLKRMKQMAAET